MTMYNRVGMGPARYHRVCEVMTLDERVAYLEGRLEEHSGSVVSLRGDMHALRADLQALRGDISRQFTWLVGIQVAMLVATIGAILRGS